MAEKLEAQSASSCGHILPRLDQQTVTGTRPPKFPSAQGADSLGERCFYPFEALGRPGSRLTR